MTVTAFQRNAFQFGAFQIAAEVDTGPRGGPLGPPWHLGDRDSKDRMRPGRRDPILEARFAAYYAELEDDEEAAFVLIQR